MRSLREIRRGYVSDHPSRSKTELLSGSTSDRGGNPIRAGQLADSLTPVWSTDAAKYDNSRDDWTVHRVVNWTAVPASRATRCDFWKKLRLHPRSSA